MALSLTQMTHLSRKLFDLSFLFIRNVFILINFDCSITCASDDDYDSSLSVTQNLVLLPKLQVIVNIRESMTEPH